MIGYISMPSNWGYRDVFVKGYPQHERFDSFRLRHPSMDNGRRAKIFSPFDALKGFSEAVAAKEVLYEFKREISEEEKDELNRRLGILQKLTYNGRMARENKVMATVTYYIPCSDKDSFSYGYRGQYLTETGIVKKVDAHSILIDNQRIPFSDIVSIESDREIDGQNIFESWYE